MFYPLYDSPDFYKQFNEKLEFLNPKIKGNLKNYQIFLRNFISKTTPYNNVLLYHKTGTGKTLTSLNIALSFLNQNGKVVVSVKNATLKTNFISQAKSFFNEDFKTLKLHKIEFVSHTNLFKQQKGRFNNYLIIIDEIHNLLNNKFYDKLMELKHHNVNIKLVLLSATPVFDNVKEIFELVNLLSDSPDAGPASYSQLFKDKLIKDPSSYKNNPNFFLRHNVYFLTNKGKEYLRNKLSGKVSYVDIDNDSSHYPKQIIKGSKFFTDKLILCKMSKTQDKLYTESLNDTKDTLFKEPSYMSILGVDSFKKHFTLINNRYNLFEPKGKFLTGLNNIKAVSGKLYELLKNILKLINKPGTIYIYSNYVNNSGVNVIKSLLIANGFSLFSTKGNSQFKFAFFENNFTQDQKDSILNVFNSKANKNGDLIKIFIGSPATSEGVNFKNIRQLHILDPHWNYSKLDQIIGRAIRFNSHEFLDKKYRNVEIYKYASVSKLGKFSIDLFKYELSLEKDHAIKEVEYILKNLAIDCHINKISHNKKYDYSRVCQYKTCNYECKTDTFKSKKIDTSTYNLKTHSKEEYTSIKNEIISLFKKYKILSISDILNKINSSIPSNIYIVLQDILNNDIPIDGKKLFYYKNYYILM